MGMTIAEKVLAKKSGKKTVTPGEIVNAYVDKIAIIETSMIDILNILEEINIRTLYNPLKVIAAIEHNIPPSNIIQAEAHKAVRKFVKKYNIKQFYEIGNSGVCHVTYVEKGFVKPGEFVIAGDSHACTYGALNCIARGVGATEMVYLLVKGYLWFKVPQTIRFYLTGETSEMVTAKDVILYIAGKYGTDVGLYKSIEFLGETVNKMSLEERQTIANMGVEIGAKFALFEADSKTIDYVSSRTTEPFEPVFTDSDAQVENEYEINVSSIEPLVSCPHDLSNVVPVKELVGLNFDQAFLGSCSNGRIGDLELAAKILKNREINPNIRMIVSPGSQAIYKEALEKGLIDIFINSGALVINASCGPCAGGSQGVLASGERCLSTTNRNFKGRMGSPESEVYLVSPATLAASCIEGKLADPRAYI